MRSSSDTERAGACYTFQDGLTKIYLLPHILSSQRDWPASHSEVCGGLCSLLLDLGGGLCLLPPRQEAERMEVTSEVRSPENDKASAWCSLLEHTPQGP